MNLRPCKCGATPVVTERTAAPVQILQVKCKCGEAGGSVMYIKMVDRERTLQAAVDGWNLAL